MLEKFKKVADSAKKVIKRQVFNFVHFDELQVKERGSVKPVFNEQRLGFSVVPYANTQLRIRYKKDLMDIVKKTPEALGIIQAIVSDIMHNYYFTSVTGDKKKSKKNIEDAYVKAKRFMLEEVLEAVLIDSMITGDGFLWKGLPMPSKEKINEMLPTIRAKVLEQLNMEGLGFKESDFDFKADRYYDEDAIGDRLQYVASTTMDIEAELNGVKGFVQRVGGVERRWNPETIIHFKWMEMDGRVNGFTPMSSVYSVMHTLAFMTDYNAMYFENGGVPDWIFNFPNEQENSPNLERLRSILSSWRNSSEKHGNLVIGGQMEKPIPLNDFKKDMEFRALAIWCTGRMALSFNMPMDRVQAIVLEGSDNGSELNDSGYWRNIRKKQNKFANLLNGQFFEDVWGVSIGLECPYLQDKIREVDWRIKATQLANNLIQMGAASDEFIYESVLSIPEEHRGGKLKPIINTGNQPGKEGGSDGSVSKKKFQQDNRAEMLKQEVMGV